MDDSERALVTGLKRGDPAAFDAAYARWRARLFGFLARLTRSRDVAEDLLQETWLRLASRAATLSDDTELGAWLFTVGRNLFVSYRRWHLLDVDRLRGWGSLPGQGRDDTSPFDLTAASQTERRVEAALASLPVTYREVVLLVAVERMEPAQAAAVLGIRPEACRQRLARARALIAERIAEAPLVPPVPATEEVS